MQSRWEISVPAQNNSFENNVIKVMDRTLAFYRLKPARASFLSCTVNLCSARGVKGQSVTVITFLSREKPACCCTILGGRLQTLNVIF